VVDDLKEISNNYII